jgi:hypothetical protein
MKTATKFIREIKKIAENKEFQNNHVMNPEKDFKRNRKLSFFDTIMFTIANTRSPLALEVERFSKYIKEKEISVAALCKARKKICSTAFQKIFEETAKIVPRNKKFHGYSVIAVDGMKGELPKTPEFTEKYSISHQSEMPVFHAVSAYDVLNEVFINSIFNFGNANERKSACDLIDAVKSQEEYSEESQIWVFDRGFPSLIMLQKLMEHNVKYVMRVSKSFLKEVNEFRCSKYVDKVVHVSCSEQRNKTNKVKSNGICEFDVRCVRIKLKNEHEEILITNLDRNEFPKRYINQLYKYRWGIETSFNYLKNAAFVEEFTTRSENGIKQDYYVSLIMYNFVTAMCESIYQSIPQKKEN